MALGAGSAAGALAGYGMAKAIPPAVLLGKGFAQVIKNGGITKEEARRLGKIAGTSDPLQDSFAAIGIGGMAGVGYNAVKRKLDEMEKRK